MRASAGCARVSHCGHFFLYKMDYKVLIVGISFFIVLSSCSMIEMESKWIPDLGWEVTCSWKLFNNDSLQSVRLCNNGQQFMIYRPQNDGTKRSQLFRLPDNVFQVDCIESSERGITGKCVIILELFQPMTADSTYTCEVSGERPTFRMETKEINVTALVGPLETAIKSVYQVQPSDRVTLNCTSRGMPAPNLVWTIGDQKIPQDFSGSTWNVSSKLWEVWSLMSYTPLDYTPPKCTPEISTSGRTVRGDPVQYNSAALFSIPTISLVLPILSIIR